MAIFVLIYQVRNYLNSKPLGLQTVLDSMAKDGIIILGLRLLINWTLVTLMNKIVPECNYYVALSIINLNVFLGLSLVVQCSTFSVIRYLFVFHFGFIASKSERKIEIITRTCVVVLASLCIIIDDFTKSRQFLYLIHSQFKEENVPEERYKSFITSITITCVSLLLMVVVQARIFYEKRKMPEPLEKYKWDFYNLKTVSLALFFVTAFILLMSSKAFVNLYVIPLLSQTMRDYFFTLVIILILIKSNNRMYEYVKKKIIPEFIQKDMEMYRRINSIPTTTSHRNLPTNPTSYRELNACNNFPNSQSNITQTPNPIVIPKSIDHVGGRNLPIQVNVNPTSNIQPSRNTLPDVSI